MVGGGGGGGALRRVGKYEVGRTIGEGTFAKVKFAQNTETGESVAMKVLDRSSILKHKMAEQVTTRAPHVFVPLCWVGCSDYSAASLALFSCLGVGLIEDWELLLLLPQIMLLEWIAEAFLCSVIEA